MKNLFKMLSFNSLFAIFLAIGFFNGSEGFAVLSAVNQSIVNMKMVLDSSMVYHELTPYHRIVGLREMKKENEHIYFVMTTEVITKSDANGLPVTEEFVIDLSIKPNSMPGRPILEVLSIRPLNQE